MTDITHEALEALSKRLLAPAYWFSGSSDGHEGESDLPKQVATTLIAIADKLRTGQLIHAVPSVEITERQSETLHKALIASCSEFVEPIVLAQPSGDEVEAVARALLQSRIARKAPGYKHLRSDCCEPFEGDVSDATAAIARLDAVRGKQ